MKISLLDAIHERYCDLIDLNGIHTYTLLYKGGNLTRTGISPKGSKSAKDLNSLEKTNSKSVSEPIKESDVKINVSNDSPKKAISTSTCVVLSGRNLNCLGDTKELENICKNLLELDISYNNFQDWNEILNLISILEKLKFLNLTSNKLRYFEKSDSNTDEERTLLIKNLNEKFSNKFNLKTLVLNECFIDFKILECVLAKLEELNELHLSRNNYESINFSTEFVHSSLKVLYINNNCLNSWDQVCKLGRHFPNLEHLVLSENKIENFSIDLNENRLDHISNSILFKNLNILNINKIKIDCWSALDQLKEFPSLKHIRIHDIPLLENFKTQDDKHMMLVGHLNNEIEILNGSSITKEFKETCERKYIRYFMDMDIKPHRYHELEAKHGKLDRLANVKLNVSKIVQVKIKFNDKHIYEKIKVRQTVGELKKSLEKFVGEPASKFRIFYIDVEAQGSFGHDELKLPNASLISLNLKDGDEFDICLKQVNQKS